MASSKPRPCVLLVEDDSADVEFARVAFEEVKLEVNLHVERDGDCALEYLRGRRAADCALKSCRPILVVLDLNLPKIEGLEVLRRMRADEGMKNMPVAVLTSSAMPEERARALQLGANLFFTKPSGLAAFVDIARKLRDLIVALG